MILKKLKLEIKILKPEKFMKFLKQVKSEIFFHLKLNLLRLSEFNICEKIIK
jgi:hypothetical protein